MGQCKVWVSTWSLFICSFLFQLPQTCYPDVIKILGLQTWLFVCVMNWFHWIILSDLLRCCWKSCWFGVAGGKIKEFWHMLLHITVIFNDKSADEAKLDELWSTRAWAVKCTCTCLSLMKSYLVILVSQLCMDNMNIA